MATRKKYSPPSVRVILPPNKRHKSKKDYDRSKEKVVKEIAETE